jgi:hypothetical protein
MIGRGRGLFSHLPSSTVYSEKSECGIKIGALQEKGRKGVEEGAE